MAEPMYKKGSLAALRAERLAAKQQQENADNIVFNNPTTPSTPNNNDLTINSNAPSIDNNAENKNDDNNNNTLNVNGDDGVHKPENSGYMDQWGFVLNEEQKQAKLREIGTDSHRAALRKQNDRIHKWLHMLDDDHWDTFNTTKKAKLKSRIRKGIPAPLRAKVWKKILGVNELKKEERLYYSKIRYQPPAAKFKQSIDNDLDRTFPRHILFQKHDKIGNGKESPTSSKSGRGKDSLRNVLYAYANHDSDVGYTQGMGFIAALFLMLMTEDDAFWCLCKLFDQNGDFQMRGLYLDGLPLLHCRYYQFNQLLLKFMPKVYEHIDSFTIMPALYASKWFITIFCYEFPFDFVYRIWDVYLHEGIKFVFRIALALIKVNEAHILKIKQFDEMMKFLQSLHNEIKNIDFLLTKAFDLPLKHEHLQVAEEAYNRKKLAEDRENRHHGGRGGRSKSRRARDDDMAAMQEIVKRKSATPNINPNGLHTPNGNYTPDSSPNDNNDEQDLNNMYKKQVEKDNNNKDKMDQVPNMVNIDNNDSNELNKKEVIMEEEETDKNEEKKQEDEGSHSANSLVDEEPSSLLPNGDHEHEPIPPNNTESNGHSANNGNSKIVDNGQSQQQNGGYAD